MIFLIPFGIFLFISSDLYVLSKYELSEKRKNILLIWSMNFLLLAGGFFLSFVSLLT